LQNVDGGFFAPPRQLLSVAISPADPRYYDNNPRAGLAFYEEILRRARSLPGVRMAAITDTLPPNRQGDADTFRIEGQTLAPGEMNPVVTCATVGPGYFEALGIPLLKGRTFNTHDTGASAAVAIVSEGFARRFFPDREALGRRIGYGEQWMEIVGVVGNVKYLGLAVDTDPAYYMPHAQNFGSRMSLVVRSGADAAPLEEALRREIQAVDPGLTLSQMSSMEEAVETSVAQPRFNTILLALFAGMALALAAIGIYGVIAYSVAQRTREIGVRMALGAARADVLRMVLRQGLWLAGAGIAAGVAGALVLTRLLNTMVFGVGVTDAPTFAAAPAAMLLVVLAATSVPALRATRISPVAALRSE
jgi:predicted permease